MDQIRKSDHRKKQPKAKPQPKAPATVAGFEAGGGLEPVELSLSYLVGDDGERTHVVMPLADFDALIDRMELLVDSLAAMKALARPKAQGIPWEEVKAELERQGKL
jgi:hypothetical protein